MFLVLVQSNLLGSIFCRLANQVQGVFLLGLVDLLVWLSLSTCHIRPQRDFIDVLAQEGVQCCVVCAVLQYLHNLILLPIYAKRTIRCWNWHVNQVSHLWFHLVYVLANHSGVVVDYPTSDSTHYPNRPGSVLLHRSHFKMKVAIHHVVLKWIVVVSLVEQWVYPPCVYLDLSMIQYVARDGYWQGRSDFLAVLWNKQLIQCSVSYSCPQHPIKQVSLEVYDNVVPVLYEVCIVVEIQYEFRIPHDLVFLPLRKLLGKGYCEVGLVQPHRYRGIWDYAICVEVYAIRFELEQGNHVHRVFPFLYISLAICMYCQVVGVQDGLEHFWVWGLQLPIPYVLPVGANLVTDVVLLYLRFSIQVLHAANAQSILFLILYYRHTLVFTIAFTEW